jgi:MFS family permease
VFLAGLAVFAAGSAFSAFSDSVGWLTAGRVVMGVGAVALMPCTLSILTNVFSTDRDRGRAIGIWSATAGLGVAIGPILGGFLLVHYWWGSVFLINVPHRRTGRARRDLPGPRLPQRPGQAARSRRDAAVHPRVRPAVVGHHRSSRPDLDRAPVLGALAASAALIAGFIIWEHRRTDPMLPVSFFRSRRYSAVIASLALVLSALMGLLFLMTQYLQFVIGLSAFQAGLAVAPVALVLLATAPISAVLAHKIGTKSVVVPGLLLIALGLGFLSQTTMGDGLRWCLPFFLLIGGGVARIPGPTGAALADAARRSFVSGMDLGLLIACIVVAAAAGVVLRVAPGPFFRSAVRPLAPGATGQPVHRRPGRDA